MSRLITNLFVRFQPVFTDSSARLFFRLEDRYRADPSRSLFPGLFARASISFRPQNRSTHPFPRLVPFTYHYGDRIVHSPIQQILDRLVSVLQIQIPRLPGQHYRRLELRQVGRKSVIELECGREHHASPFVHGNRNRDADRELENGGKEGRV